MNFSPKNKKYRSSNANRSIITALAIILLGASALLAYPGSLLATSHIVFTESGNCDSRDKDENLWAKGYCLGFDVVKHQVLADTVINELRRYSISVYENATDARTVFSMERQEAIDKKVSIGGSGGEKIGPEDVSIGDAGFIEIAKFPRRGYVGSTSLIPDTDNANEGYFDEYKFDPTFLQGKCIVSWVFLGITNYTEAYKTNHREEFYRTLEDRIRYKLVNSHPASDHSLKEETKTVIVNDLQNLAGRLAPVCGGAVTSPAPTSPVEKLPEVEALVEKQPSPEVFFGPSEEDLIPEELRRRHVIGPYLSASSFKDYPLHINKIHVEGQPELHLPDGSVVILRENDDLNLLIGSKIITPPRSRLIIGFMYLEESSQVEFKPWLPPTASPDLPGLATFEIQKGYGRFKEQKTILRKASATGVAPITRGTDFAIAFDPVTRLTTIELYDGGIDVTGTDGTMLATLDTNYGKPIQRVEVTENGGITKQIAIPKDEWQKRQTVEPEQQGQQKSSSRMWILVILLLGAGVFVLHKTGKLRPILQKVLALARRKDSIQS